jgi:hypothetical protein
VYAFNSTASLAINFKNKDMAAVMAEFASSGSAQLISGPQSGSTAAGTKTDTFGFGLSASQIGAYDTLVFVLNGVRTNQNDTFVWGGAIFDVPEPSFYLLLGLGMLGLLWGHSQMQGKNVGWLA